MNDLRGPITPIITPFYEGRSDLDSFSRVADHIIEGGCSNLFILGTTGEDLALSFDTKRKLIAHVGKNYAGRVNILAGTSGNTIEETAELTKYVGEQGIDIVVLTPLLKSHLDPVEYVSQAVDGTNVKVVAYNIPEKTNGRYLTIDEVSNLARLPKVVAFKESSGNMGYFAQVAPFSSDSFGLFPGSMEHLGEAFDMAKIHGFVPSAGNTRPDLVARIWADRNPEDLQELKKIAIRYKQFGSPAEAEKLWAYEQGLIRSKEMAINGRH